MSRAVIVISGNYDRDRAAQWAKSAPSGCIIEFKQSKRTLDQNARLWACLTEIARKVDWYGQKLPADDWKDVFTAALRRTRVVPGIDAGTFVPLGMRTSDMTKQEFSDLLELINAFAAEHGVTFDFDDAGDTTETGAGDRTADPDETGEPAGEADHGDTAAGSPVDPSIKLLMEECVENMLRDAFSEPAIERPAKVEKLRDVFLEPQNLGGYPEFVNRCADTALKVIGKPDERARAKEYLQGRIPA